MTETSPPHYLLGHPESELRRLDLQGRLYRDVTRRALVQAGLEPGMRVLDIGCGTGDVSLLAAEIVGSKGRVRGVDRGEAALAAARAKAERRGVEHVDFRKGEIDAIDERGAFDALVGRFILMHQPDPGRALAAAARAVRADGVVLMIESWMELIRGSHSHPHSPLYHRLVDFKCEVVRRAGADTEAGGRLHETFLAAGLPSPTCRMETRLEGGATSPYYEYLAESLRSMLAEAGRRGVEGFGESDVRDVADRLRDEVVASGGVLVVWPAVYASARKI